MRGGRLGRRWHDKAGERILEGLVKGAEERLEEEGIRGEIFVFKNNTDSAGNSYGCHENYLVDRATPFGELVSHGTAHLVTRQIFTGAGKVGSEVPGLGVDEVPYQLTQRADFFEEDEIFRNLALLLANAEKRRQSARGVAINQKDGLAFP